MWFLKVGNGMTNHVRFSLRQLALWCDPFGSFMHVDANGPSSL